MTRVEPPPAPRRCGGCDRHLRVKGCLLVCPKCDLIDSEVRQRGTV